MYWYGKVYYLEHICSVPPDPDPIARIFHGNNIFARLHRKFRALCVVSTNNIGARLVYPSSMAMKQETLRHLDQSPYMIHPYSLFRKAWEDLMIIVYSLSIAIIPYDGIFITKEARYEYSIYRLIVFLLSILCGIDIVVNFATGYYNSKTKNVELQFKSVALNYLKFFFWVDALSTVPFISFDHIFKNKINDKTLSACIFDTKWSEGCFWDIILLMGALKLFRFFTLLLYIEHHITRAVRQNFYIFNMLKTVLVFLYYIYCITLFEYSLYKIFRNKNQIFNKIATSLFVDSISSETYDNFQPIYRFYYLYYRITYSFLLYSFDINAFETIQDIALTTIINLIGYILRAYVLAQVIMTVKSANLIKFHQTQYELKQYMKHIELSNDIQSRILDFYEFRMQGYYFKENEIVNIIGYKLKNDIILNSCHSFIESVHFFSNLPTHLIMRIIAYLKTEVYMINDVIINPGIKNTTLYFIITGRVAVYDEYDVEVTHLDDGSHFGEMSLILDDKVRFSKIVALESCNLFTLSRYDLLRALAPYPENLKKIIESLKLRHSRLTQIAFMKDEMEGIVTRQNNSSVKPKEDNK